MIYRVANSIIDAVNGISLTYNQFIETDEKQWVARMGDSLHEEHITPPNVEIIIIKNTLESKTPAGVVLDEKEVSKTSPPNKAILGNKSENK